MHHLNELQEYLQIIKNIDNGAVSVTGITESARADFIFAVLQSTNKSGFIVVENVLDARVLKEDLEFYLGEDKVEIFPSKDYIFHNIETAAMQLYNKRIEIIEKMVSGREMTVIAPIDAVMQYTLPPEILQLYSIELKAGVRIDFKTMLQKLIIMGYKRADVVEGIGQMNLRGGILDIFPPSYDMPVRIEFFDDEVDTIRFFSPESQLSLEHADSCTIVCNRELIFDDVDKIKSKILKYPQTEWTKHDITQFEEEHYFPAVDRYLPLIYPKLNSVLSYLDERFVLFLDYPSKLQDRAENYAKEMETTITQFVENGALPMYGGNYIINIHDLMRGIKASVITVSNIAANAGFIKTKTNFNIQSRSLQSYQGRIDMILGDIKYWSGKKYAVTVLAGSKSKAEAFHKTLIEQNFPARLCETPEFAGKGEITVSTGSISRGFEYPILSVAVISSRELFGTGRHRKKASTMPGIKLKSYADLDVGDYVVHQVHGIGRYLGLHRIEIDNITRDYLKIQYKDSDVLYVPATALDTINKYISNEGRELKLNKMGGVDFNKVKTKVKKSLEDIADQLVALYATRNAQKGYAFASDNDWQKNFEDQFPYEETPDQLNCIEEMKTDMENERPMDRLLCGDVGFGKTEVALRGAFKAVMDSKQVAYLVPTTILAQQHYNTFLQRMKDFPINVEMLSRFRTPKQQKEIIKRISSGEIDIVIGTHRLLQKDIKFKDLGFLIIDEEQRFGVKHKESIKELKKDVDVLTLSATPIPRTLHMSLIGVRDMSVIAQPPEDRYPVQTFIAEYDKEVIRDAILKELGRNGQVYYVYNRVEGIYKVANMLQEMAPSARIAVGHGKMSERELENVMMDTLSGEVDILVCTTIIETGLDIPNINTIVIENSDCMGLSQLYQLRGRVGRSNRLAYAYLTYRKDKALTETALKRLTAIREFTEFGSGFKIAMRDLEIRGAGNMLGAQQHGEMDAVGYDMYCKLLEEAVQSAKGEVKKSEILTSVDIKINTYIPEKYIPSHNIRIEVYKRIAATTNEEDKENIIDELIDRFGQPPESVMNLIEISLIRVYANNAGISDVVEKNKKILMYFDKTTYPDTQKIASLAAKYRGQILYNGGAKPYITYVDFGGSTSKMLGNVKTVLSEYGTMS